MTLFRIIYIFILFLSEVQYLVGYPLPYFSSHTVCFSFPSIENIWKGGNQQQIKKKEGAG